MIKIFENLYFLSLYGIEFKHPARFIASWDFDNFFIMINNYLGICGVFY